MKIHTVLLSVALLFAQFVQAQTRMKDAGAEKRNVGVFKALEASLGMKVYLYSGDEPAVYVSADNPEHIEYIKTEVVDNTLRITVGSINKLPKNLSGLKAYVTVKDLEKITAGTGAEVIMEDKMDLAALALNTNTGATVYGKLGEVGKLSASLSTGSRIELEGKAKEVNVDCNLGSKFRAFDLEASRCVARVHTSGLVEVNVEDLFSAVATTGGNIHYKGNASIQEVQIKTGGSVVSKK
jgi:hypothetical protein